MISVSFHENSDSKIIGFTLSGHAGYAESGSDIICAAVSALVINAMNSIESFSSDTFTYDEDEESGFIDFKIISSLSPVSELLLKSLELGLEGIQEGYGTDYIQIN